MADVVVVAIVVILIFGAALYIYRAKKNGQKCIGCPYSKECNGRCGLPQQKRIVKNEPTPKG